MKKIQRYFDILLNAILGTTLSFGWFWFMKTVLAPEWNIMFSIWYSGLLGVLFGQARMFWHKEEETNE